MLGGQQEWQPVEKSIKSALTKFLWTCNECSGCFSLSIASPFLVGNKIPNSSLTTQCIGWLILLQHISPGHDSVFELQPWHLAYQLIPLSSVTCRLTERDFSIPSSHLLVNALSNISFNTEPLGTPLPCAKKRHFISPYWRNSSSCGKHGSWN